MRRGCHLRAEALVTWSMKSRNLSHHWTVIACLTIKARGSAQLHSYRPYVEAIVFPRPPMLSTMPCVITGVRTTDPQLPFACADHHAISLLAVSKAMQAGWLSALVLDRVIDELVQGRFTAGFMIGQGNSPNTDRIPPFYHCERATCPPKEFISWFTVINRMPSCTLSRRRQSGADTGVAVPQKTALIQLELRSQTGEWWRLTEHNDRTGAAAETSGSNDPF